MIDGGNDWRDEQLLLRDLRTVALEGGLPFEALIRQAADCSSPATAMLLLGVLESG